MSRRLAVPGTLPLVFRQAVTASISAVVLTARQDGGCGLGGIQDR